MAPRPAQSQRADQSLPEALARPRHEVAGRGPRSDRQYIRCSGKGWVLRLSRRPEKSLAPDLTVRDACGKGSDIASATWAGWISRKALSALVMITFSNSRVCENRTDYSVHLLVHQS